MSLRDSYKDLRQENFIDKVEVGAIVLVRNIQPEYVKRRHYWSLARVLSVIKGHDGKVRSATVLKGSADYLKRKREPEVHPVNHLYPLELSLTHEYRSSLPDVEIVPEDINPILDFTNYEEPSNESLDETILQSSEHGFDTDGMEPNFVPIASPSDLSLTNLEPTGLPSDSVLPNLVPTAASSNVVEPNLSAAPPVQFSRRGRLIKPPPGHADFVPFY